MSGENSERSSLVFWAEVSTQIGMGHFMECLAIAECARSRGHDVHFWVSPFKPALEILKSKAISFDRCEAGENHLAAQSSCIVVNHRAVKLEILKELRKKFDRVIVIDQLGNKAVHCDVLINSTLIQDWLKYEFVDCKPKRCFGAAYAILRGEFCTFHQQARVFDPQQLSRPPRILVTMGGVDRTGATLRISKALWSPEFTGVEVQVILGRGFAHKDAFEAWYQIKELGTEAPNILYAQGVSDLAHHMTNADLVLSAGGNTVYELACVGTPGLVFWEDPHEELQAKAFEKEGVLENGGNGLKTSLEEIRHRTLKLLQDTERRSKMSRLGKKLVDGLGLQRIVEVIGKGLCSP